jgi:hypothetical protein
MREKSSALQNGCPPSALALFAPAAVIRRFTFATITMEAGAISCSRTWCRLDDYDMAARADLVIDEPSILQFRHRNDLLIALSRLVCGRLDKYQIFTAFCRSSNDMLNGPSSTSWQRSFCKQEWTSVTIRK